MNNYLYIAINGEGLIKIGLTDGNPILRIEKFSKEYEIPFEPLLIFDVKNTDNDVAESILHQLFNSQLLNTAFIHKEMSIFDFVKYNKNSPDGYTEIFLANSKFLANSLTILHLNGIITLQEENLDSLTTITEYPIQRLQNKYPAEFNKIRLRENNKISLLKPNYNNRNIIFKKNFSKFLKLSENFENLNLKYQNKELYLTNNSIKSNLSNLLHGNDDISILKKIITEFKLSESNIDLKSFAKILIEQNQKISVQKNPSFTKNEKKKYISNLLKMNEPFKKALIHECNKILKEYNEKIKEPDGSLLRANIWLQRSTVNEMKKSLSLIIDDINTGIFFDKINLGATKRNNTTLTPYNMDGYYGKAYNIDLERLSIVFNLLKEKKDILKFLPNLNSLSRYTNNVSNLFKFGKNIYYKKDEIRHIDKMLNLVFWNKEYYDYASTIFKNNTAYSFDEILPSEYGFLHQTKDAIKSHLLMREECLEYLKSKKIYSKIYEEQKKNINSFTSKFIKEETQNWSFYLPKKENEPYVINHNSILVNNYLLKFDAKSHFFGKLAIDTFTEKFNGLVHQQKRSLRL